MFSHFISDRFRHQKKLFSISLFSGNQDFLQKSFRTLTTGATDFGDWQIALPPGTNNVAGSQQCNQIGRKFALWPFRKRSFSIWPNFELISANSTWYVWIYVVVNGKMLNKHSRNLVTLVAISVTRCWK